jgi:urea transport system substrate-binding protein
VVRLSGALEENGLYALGGDRTGELFACMPSFAAADGAADESQLALQERLAGRSGPTAPVVCAYARGLYDGVREAVRLATGRRASGRPASTPRLAHADGLHFREVTLPRTA